jgi:hypothetical protein
MARWLRANAGFQRIGWSRVCIKASGGHHDEGRSDSRFAICSIGLFERGFTRIRVRPHAVVSWLLSARPHPYLLKGGTAAVAYVSQTRPLTMCCLAVVFNLLSRCLLPWDRCQMKGREVAGESIDVRPRVSFRSLSRTTPTSGSFATSFARKTCACSADG